VEEGNSFNVSVFNKKGGSNGFYITRDFTQSNLGAKEHSLKLDENITKFIKKEKLEKIKKKKLSLDVLNLTARELICMFYGYIFENKEYFEKNEIIKKINQNFINIRKYPFIDFENGKSDDYNVEKTIVAFSAIHSSQFAYCSGSGSRVILCLRKEG
jgi:hypothetical protein